MNYLTLLITLFFAAASNASPAGKPTVYELEQLSDVSLSTTSQGYVLTYTTAFESLYFSPGIKLIDKEDGTYIEVVRCKIDHECTVDFKSVYDDNGRSEVLIASDTSKDSFILLGSNTSTKLEYRYHGIHD